MHATQSLRSGSARCTCARYSSCAIACDAFLYKRCFHGSAVTAVPQ